MKSIEHKLKADAQAFNHEPNIILHEKIMQNIKSEALPKVKKTNTLLKWLIPASVALTILFLLLPHQPNKKTNNFKTSHEISPPIAKVKIEQANSQQLDIDFLATTLESKLTNPIEKEQKAISNDLNYLKSLLFL